MDPNAFRSLLEKFPVVRSRDFQGKRCSPSQRSPVSVTKAKETESNETKHLWGGRSARERQTAEALLARYCQLWVNESFNLEELESFLVGGASAVYSDENN